MGRAHTTRDKMASLQLELKRERKRNSIYENYMKAIKEFDHVDVEDARHMAGAALDEAHAVGSDGIKGDTDE